MNNDLSVIRVSKLKTFQRCERAFKLNYVDGLVTLRPNKHFIFGRATHYGVGLILQKNPDFVQLTLDFLAKEIEVISLSYRTETLNSTFLEFKSILRGLLPAYQKFYSNFIDRIQHIENEVEVEYAGLTNSDYPRDFKFAGTIDNLITLDGKVYVYELKTTSILDENQIEKHLQSLQVWAYYYAYMQRNPDVGGIIFDIIQKPTIRQKKTESKSEYVLRLSEYYADGTRFFTKMISNAEYVTKYQRGVGNLCTMTKLFASVSDAIHRKAEQDNFLPNYESCAGSFKCDYFDLCHAPNQVEHDLMLNHFTTKEAL